MTTCKTAVPIKTWAEYVDSMISIYETGAIRCEVSKDEKPKILPVALIGDALLQYFSIVNHSTTHVNAFKAL